MERQVVPSANNAADTPLQQKVQDVNEQLQHLAPPDINLRVSSDNLVAYIRVRLADQRQTVTPEDILSVLSAQGITYGIDHEAIQNYCENRLFFTELTAARGVAPIPGKMERLPITLEQTVRFN